MCDPVWGSDELMVIVCDVALDLLTQVTHGATFVCDAGDSSSDISMWGRWLPSGSVSGARGVSGNPKEPYFTLQKSY